MAETGMRSKGKLLVGVAFKIIENWVQSSLGIWGFDSRIPLPLPKSVHAQIPYIKWCNIWI